MSLQPRVLTVFLLVSGVSALALGCEEEKPGVDPGLIGQMMPDMNPDPAPVPDPQPDDIPENTVLTIVGEDVLELAFDTRGTMKVQYTTVGGEAIADAPVNFEVLGGADLMLEASTATTDSKGEATNGLFAGRQEGLFEVLASAPNADPVKFTVFVFPQDEAAYRVVSEYEGGARLVGAEVRLVSADFSCAGITAQAIPASVAAEEVSVGVGQPIPDVVFGDLPNDTAYTVVVVGFIEPRLPAAIGCNDAREPINAGMGVRVSVTLEEVLPSLAGDYDILTRVDLTDALPEPWASNVQFVGGVFADPVRSLVDFLFGDPNDNGDGLAGRFLDDTPARRMLVTGILTDLITATSVGQSLESWFGVGGEAYRVVTEFGLGGSIGILQEPDESGRLVSGNAHRYEDIVIDWTIDCERGDLECSRIELGLDEINGVGVLTSSFTGHVEAGPRLFVDRHGFDFNYGAIAVAIMERVVLPRTFGVDSIGRAVGLLVDCEAFGEALFPGNFLFAIGAEEACGFALDAVVEEVVGRLSGSGLGLPDLSLATFDAETDPQRAGCLMGEPAYDGDDVLRRVGAVGTEEARCDWDARFESEGGDGQVGSDFYATRR